MAENLNITLTRGDDTTFLNQVLLVVYFKTNLNLDGYKARFTIENPHNIMKQFEVQHNSIQIDFDKIISSTMEVGTHKANIKLIDTLGRIKTVHNFNIYVNDEFDVNNIPTLNEYELEIVLDNDGINKYKNYDELHNKPQINDVILEGNKNFDELGITEHITNISNTGIEEHNTDKFAHMNIQEQIFNKQDRLIAGSNITIIDGIISSLGAEGGVTTDYKQLGNKPKINDVVLVDNISLDELGIQSKGEYVTEEILNQKGFLTSVPSGYITEQELEAEGYIKEIPPEYFTNKQNEEIYATKEEVIQKQDKLTAGDNISITTDDTTGVTTISSTIPEEYITEEELNNQNFITDDILQNKLKRKQNIMLAGNNIRFQNNSDGSITISAIDSKSQAEISSYNALTNKPTINGVTLLGNKTAKELGLQPEGDYQNKLIVGDNIKIKDNVISAIIPDDICTDNKLQLGLQEKADKATTLKGYNIEDAYTKDEVETLIQLSNENKVTDIIIDAPNGVASYTETSLTIQSGLKVLFSDGLLEDYSYKNLLGVVPEDITIDTSKLDYNDFYKEFYLVLIYNNGVMYSTILPKAFYKTIVSETIPNTELGYIKNINENIIYRMVTDGSGIYRPEQVYIKIVGEGTIIPLEQEFIKIASFTPYSVYRLVNEDELLAQIKDLQPKFKVGKNFTFDKNILEYHIPFNYVTKEFLIDNEFATLTNINDRVDIHNSNQYSHQDIRNTLVKKQQKLVAGNNIILTNNGDGTQTISSTIPSTNYVTRDELRLELQNYAEITDIPDARNYVTLDKYNELINTINDLKQQIEELTK